MAKLSLTKDSSLSARGIFSPFISVFYETDATLLDDLSAI